MKMSTPDNEQLQGVTHDAVWFDEYLDIMEELEDEPEDYRRRYLEGDLP